MGAVALTDHGNLFGALQFQKACRRHGVKPILGCEVYVSPTTRGDRTSRDARRNQHFILLAEGSHALLNPSASLRQFLSRSAARSSAAGAVFQTEITRLAKFMEILCIR